MTGGVTGGEDPSRPAGQLALIGRLLTEAGRAEALPAVREAAAQQPQTIRMALRLGHHLLPTDPVAAEAAFRAALAAEPGHEGAHIGLTEALWRQERRAEALAAARDAVMAVPGNPRLLNRLGHLITSAEGDPGDAELAYRAALAAAPDLALAHLGLCEALRRQDRLKEAVAAFRQAEALGAAPVPLRAQRYRLFGEFGPE